MRRLMWLGLGFTLACVVGVYLLSGNLLWIPAIVCLVGAAVLLLIKTPKTKICAVILFGALIGFLWNWGYDALYLSEARQYDTKTVQTQIEITDYHTETDYGVAASGKIELAGRTYRVYCYIPGESQLKPGDRVTGSFRLRYTADGGEKEPTYHQGKGIFLLAYGNEDGVVTAAETVPTKYLAATLRQKILFHLDNLFPEDTLGFARALLLGDSSKLSYEQDVNFRTSGLRHVIAVSGLHVSILFSVIYLFGGRHKVLGVVLGLPLLLMFAAVAGFTPSIIRACIMQALMTLSLLFDKEYDPPTALAFSVLVMLTINPLTITSVSFQLSVGCLIGIFLFSDKIRNFLRQKTFLRKAKKKTRKAQLANWFAGSVSITLSAMITTTPLCAYYFESVSLIGVVANLLTLWVVSFIFYGIVAACVLGAIWMPLGKIVAWVISWLMRYVLGVAKICSSLPLAAVYTKSMYIVLWLILVYALIAVMLFMKKKRPWLFSACVAGVLCLAVSLSYLEPKLNQFSARALDVGQGQCILIQSGNRVYMVDCGGDWAEKAADEAAHTLLSQGIRRLDGLILTHYDYDHADGAALLLQRIPAETLYLPTTDDQADTEPFRKAWSDKILWIGEDAQFTDGNISFDLYPAPEGTSSNETSMCVLFQVENCDILITGDRNAAGERQLVETHDLPDVDVLVVGHHGAKTTACLELLRETRPEFAVISVSEDNAYGHPAQDVLDRLELFGCTVLRTDQMGEVMIEG